MRFSRIVALGCALSISTGAAAAQDYTVKELRRLFELQKQAFTEASQSELGQTRGLKLVTIDNVSVEPSQDSVTVAAGTEMSENTETVTQVAADPNKPLVFGQLAPDLQVNLHIKFGFDSAALATEEKPKLEKMCLVLQTSSIKVIRVVGHTDTSGSEEYNERLSVLRAKEVARHLIEECGIAASRLETIGMGERFPFNAQNPRADENRRVEFQALS